MNIFLVSSSVNVCAESLDNLRLNKMILETGQMLCTAYRYWAPKYGKSPTFDGIYKETHVNHPCNVWLRIAPVNFIWGCDLLHALYREKIIRTNVAHKTFSKLKQPLEDLLKAMALGFPELLMYNEKDIQFSFDCSNQNVGDVFTNYKHCLIKKWNDDLSVGRQPKFSSPIPEFATFDGLKYSYKEQ